MYICVVVGISHWQPFLSKRLHHAKCCNFSPQLKSHLRVAMKGLCPTTSKRAPRPWMHPVHSLWLSKAIPSHRFT